MPSELRISLIQTDIVWENKQENLSRLEKKIEKLTDATDIAVLPEMFSTGFSMKSEELAETIEGETITVLKQWSKKFNFAITGSFIALEGDTCFNRAFFLTPKGEEYYYDKHHLFRMGDEPNHFQAGNRKLVFNYLGWNICLMVCYDLRFPAWCRNIQNEYDLFIIVASWPAPRRRAWEILLCARAIENLSYVCGVNRVGTDGHGLKYSGQSALYNAKGEIITEFTDGEEGIHTTKIDLASLRSLREKFPTWKDADRFTFI